MDIEKQVKYWVTGAKEDWDAAEKLIQLRKFRHGLFFLHLSLEKLLKAHVCRKSGKLAPKFHNLTTLANKASLELTPDQMTLLSTMNSYNLEGRYPDILGPTPAPGEADEYLKRSKGFFSWLAKQL